MCVCVCVPAIFRTRSSWRITIPTVSVATVTWLWALATRPQRPTGHQAARRWARAGAPRATGRAAPQRRPWSQSWTPELRSCWAVAPGWFFPSRIISELPFPRPLALVRTVPARTRLPQALREDGVEMREGDWRGPMLWALSQSRTTAEGVRTKLRCALRKWLFVSFKINKWEVFPVEYWGRCPPETFKHPLIS